jgi:hypothetical protein
MQNVKPAAEPAELDQAEELKADVGTPKEKSDQAEELKEEVGAPEGKSGQAEELKAESGAPEEESEEVRTHFVVSEEIAAKLKAKTEEIKEAIALKVREDSREHAALTPGEDIIALDVDLRYGRIDLNAVLAEMAIDERYKDIITITTATGLIFVYSADHIAADDAAAKSLVEEAKFMLANTIRVDSYQNIKLTPVGDIYAMAPDTEPAIIDIILKGMAQEARYADIKSVVSAAGDVYYHSDKFIVDSYAATLLLAMAGDHCNTLAEKVREESRIYPRATNVTFFHNQQLFGIPRDDLEAVIAETLRKQEYSDIKKVVHPTTGAVYLYSERYLQEDQAWAQMEWLEVGLARNP